MTSAPAVGNHPRPVLLGLVAITTAAATIGAAFFSYLAVHHPLALLALNAWPRHMILVAPRLDMWSFMLVASSRNFWACVLGHEVGIHYGARGIDALRNRSPRMYRFVNAAEHFFSHSAWVVLLLFPGMLSASFAGMNRMRRRSALPLLLIGVTGWAAINYRLGGLLSPYTDAILSWFRDHMLVATLGSAAIAVLYELRRRQKQRSRESLPGRPSTPAP